MTNLEALQAEIEPYTLSKAVLEKALADSGLSPSQQYISARAIALATVYALSKLTVLSKETEGKFSQDYAGGSLVKRITAICTKYGYDVSEFVPVSSISDGSNMW